MRKTQVALAALALVASTAAMAGEVSISGQIDIGMFNTDRASNGAGGSYMEQGALLDHSSITLNAKEDLGNGLKAMAVLESGFNAGGAIDNGGNNASNTGALFNRQALVGLGSDTLGTVGLGRQLSPFILSQALTNFGVGGFWVPRLALGNNGVGGGFAGGGNGINATGFFIPNSVTYTSPSIGGFTVRGLTASATGTENNGIVVNNAAATATSSSNRYDSLSVDGNIGSVFVSSAWQKRQDAYSSWTIGGTMPIVEGLSLMANYMSDKATVANTTIKSWAAGGKYTVAQGTDVILQYAQNDADGNAEKTLTNLTLTHALSKRTTAYAMAGRGKNTGSAIGNFGNTFTGINNNTYGVGIAHSF